MIGIERTVVVPVRVAAIESSCSTTDKGDRIPTTTTAVLPQSTRPTAAASTGRGSEDGGLVRRALGFGRSVPASPERADDDEEEESDEASGDDDPNVLCDLMGRFTEGQNGAFFFSPDRSSLVKQRGGGTHHAGILTLPPVPDNRLRQIARTDPLFDSLGLAVGDNH